MVVTQALYKEKNRKWLHEAFPEALFIWVKASPTNISKRLQNRLQTVNVTGDYALQLSANFETPELPHWSLTNDEDRNAVILQLKRFFNEN